MSTKRMGTCMIAAALLLAACGRDEGEPTDRQDRGGTMDGMSDMRGMEGMDGMDGAMMGRMGAHMQMMQAMSGDSMRAMLSTHRQMVANMIAQMNREMRDMNMTADAEWNSTIDAVRTDLTRLPEMTTAELESFMPEHRERVRRLMEMHHGMMGNMQM